MSLRAFFSRVWRSSPDTKYVIAVADLATAGATMATAVKGLKDRDISLKNKEEEERGTEDSSEENGTLSEEVWNETQEAVLV